MKKIVLILSSLLIAALALAGCGSDAKPAGGAKTVLKVGATAVPHAEILQAVKPVLEKEERDKKMKGWERAVTCSYGWAKEDDENE